MDGWNKKMEEEQQKLSFKAALERSHVEGSTLAIMADAARIPEQARKDMLAGQPAEPASVEAMRAALAKDFPAQDWATVSIPVKQKLSVIINTSPITAQFLISQSGLNPDLVLAATLGKKVHPQVAEKLLKAVNQINQTTHYTITDLTADSCLEPVYSFQAAPLQGIAQEGIDE